MPAMIRMSQIDDLCADLQALQRLTIEGIRTEGMDGITTDELGMIFERRRTALLTRLESRGVCVRADPVEVATPDER